jgi:hypothetical protein
VPWRPRAPCRPAAEPSSLRNENLVNGSSRPRYDRAAGGAHGTDGSERDDVLSGGGVR